MNTKILASVVIVTLATAGTLTYAASTNTGSTNILKNAFSGMHRTGSGELNEKFEGKMEGRGLGMMEKGPMTNLTDGEKTKLATMTDTEKKAFFEVKMTEQKALRDAQEVVMDKLINEVALSDAEKVTLATIKTKHNAQKAEKASREAKMTEMKTLLEKVKVGIALTTDEQTKLDAFKTSMPQGEKEGRGGKKGGMMKGMGR